MTPAPVEILERFAGLRALVVGDAMLDRYFEGSSGRVAQEAPVPVVGVESVERLPGGAANSAANLRALGAEVALLAAAGDDAEGGALRAAIIEHAIPDEDVVEIAGRRTLSKQRVVAGGQILLRFDQGDTGVLDADAQLRLRGRLREHWETSDVVVVSDYGYGVMTDALIDELAGLQERAPRVVLVDAKDLRAYRRARPTVVKPNRGQAEALLGGRLGEEGLVERGDELLDLTGAQIAAVTLDAEGALVLERDRPPYRTYARPSSATTTAGAGDTFGAVFALGVAAGADGPSAAECASAAAAVAVSKHRTSTCSLEELRARMSGTGKLLEGEEAIRRRFDLLRAQRRRIVFTNGCFDILHRGHVTYLSRAKSLGDVLVIGLNSDRSVRALKGEGRPVNTLEDRAHVLCAMSCVDHVVGFDEPTPEALIRLVRPDLFVKGGDYTIAMLPEAPVVRDLGGEVHILPYVENRSTTAVIERIRSRAGDVAAPGGP